MRGHVPTQEFRHSIFDLTGKTNSVLVTGGAGFIGSYLVERLLQTGSNVKVFDNLSSGSIMNLSNVLHDPKLELIQGDLLNREQLKKAVDESEIVFHLAANPAAKVLQTEDDVFFESNILSTKNLLDSMRDSSGARKLCFTSSSTVYGQASTLPTPEGHGPLMPLSMYGASKLACEALISAYSAKYGLVSTILRLGNVLGIRKQWGLAFDVITKLRTGEKVLQLRGNGTQTRSYILVQDLLSAIDFAVSATQSTVEIFNVAYSDCLDALGVARAIIHELCMSDVALKPDHVRSDTDVERVWLDASKLASLGWRTTRSSESAIRAYARDLWREVQ